MSMFGQVYVKKNQYKIKGDFHHLTPNMPIRNADDGWKLMGVTNPRDMTYIHSYGGEAIFFESLSQGKLMATRCDNKKCESKGSILSALQDLLPRLPGKELSNRYDHDRTERLRKSIRSWYARDQVPSACSISLSNLSISNSTAYAPF